MAKMRKWAESSNESVYLFHCPGCGVDHVISSKIHQVSDDLNNPTITPSIGYFNYPPICHSFVVDGKIKFLSDSTHKLSGQTVELPEL